MRRIIISITTSVAVLLSLTLIAQNEDWCGTDYYLQKSLLSNPSLKQQYEEGFSRVREIIANNPDYAQRTGVVQYIPVVVHVIHDNGIGNISKAQVDDAIKVLNEDFRRVNADTSDTRAVFKPYAADSELEFRLAQKDPNGDCTSGIVRVNSPLTNGADDAVKSLSYWASNKYMNLWVVNSIDGGGPGIILGYAQFPGGQWNKYGVVIRNDWFGRIGTSSTDGRTLSHEIGHCLGLYHTFQIGCGNNCASSGDDICDTPPVANSTQGCNQNLNTCSNDASGPSPYTSDVVNQIENYMSYDDCQNMFSLDQKTRMKAVINAYSQLQNLTSGSNLAATGTDGNNILCAADFSADYTTICAGESVQFMDESYHGQLLWNWTFAGGSPNVSTSQNVSVIYWTPGIYDVSLNVGNGINNLTEAKASYIVVLPSPGEYMPYSEGFENDPIPNQDWVVYNLDGDYTWATTSNASYSGSKSVKLNNFNTPDDRVDELMSGSFDLSPLTSAQIKFKMAFAQRFTSNDDMMRVYISYNCGQNWAIKWMKLGASLATVGLTGVQFTPSSTNDWREETISVTLGYMVEDFRFKFVFTSGGGNHMYIDDINIDGTYDRVPFLVSPFDGALNQADNVLLDWKAVEGIDNYEYQLDAVTTFDSPLLVTGTNAYISTSPYNPDTEHQTANLLHDQNYYWRARTLTMIDTSAWSATWMFHVSQSGVGNEELNEPIGNFEIYPNPFSENTVIAFRLAQSAHVQLSMYDLCGRQVAQLQNGQLSKGTHRISLENSYASGLYLIKLTAGNSTSSGKLMVR